MAKEVVDSKDKKILEMLTDEGKCPLKRIASKLRMPKESVAYRIRRLEQLNILRECIAKIDMTRFYQNSYLILFRFSKTSPELQKERIDFLVSSPYSMWVASLSGEYDIAVSFLTRDTNDLHDFVSSIEQEIGGGLKYEIYTYTREFKNSFKDMFRTEKGLPKPADGFMMRSFSPKQLVEIDDRDRLILYALSRDAKITNASIALVTALSEEGVRQRVKALEAGGIITGYRHLINIYNMSLEIYIVLLRFQNLTKEIEDEVKMYIQTDPNIYYSARVFGNYNVTMCLTAKDRFDFQDIMDRLRNRFGDKISKYNSQIIFGVHKHTYFPHAVAKVPGFDKARALFAKPKTNLKQDARC